MFTVLKFAINENDNPSIVMYHKLLLICSTFLLLRGKALAQAPESHKPATFQTEDGAYYVNQELALIFKLFAGEASGAGYTLPNQLPPKFESPLNLDKNGTYEITVKAKGEKATPEARFTVISDGRAPLLIYHK